MNVYPDKLKQTLERKVMPVYFFSGDEPLQLMEAADLVRSVCKQAGFAETERFHVDNARSFDWQAFAMSGNSMSLFGDKKVVNLHIPSGKPGTEGAAALKNGVNHHLTMRCLLSFPASRKAVFKPARGSRQLTRSASRCRCGRCQRKRCMAG